MKSRVLSFCVFLLGCSGPSAPAEDTIPPASSNSIPARGCLYFQAQDSCQQVCPASEKPLEEHHAAIAKYTSEGAFETNADLKAFLMIGNRILERSRKETPTLVKKCSAPIPKVSLKVIVESKSARGVELSAPAHIKHIGAYAYGVDPELQWTDFEQKDMVYQETEYVFCISDDDGNPLFAQAAHVPPCGLIVLKRSCETPMSCAPDARCPSE